jgi:hypothetical protein
MLPLPPIRFDRRASNPEVKPQDRVPGTPEQRRELDALHEYYIERVNKAIDEDRDDLALARRQRQRRGAPHHWEPASGRLTSTLA